MQIYFIVCLVMLALVYLRIWGETIAFKKKYPNAVFRKTNFIKTISNITKLLIVFVVPVLNVFMFIRCMFTVSDERIEEIIKEKCEVY